MKSAEAHLQNDLFIVAVGLMMEFVVVLGILAALYLQKYFAVGIIIGIGIFYGS